MIDSVFFDVSRDVTKLINNWIKHVDKTQKILTKKFEMDKTSGGHQGGGRRGQGGSSLFRSKWNKETHQYISISYFERLNSYFESLNSYFESLNSYFKSLNSYLNTLIYRHIKYCHITVIYQTMNLIYQALYLKDSHFLNGHQKHTC